jgi:hypothetical protein
MPSWLTERPRWAEPSTQKEPVVARTLPKPDTSPIELSSILDVSDLPNWLQNVARRAEQRTAVAAAEPVVETPPETAIEQAITAEPDEDAWRAVAAVQTSDGAEELEPAEPVVAEALHVDEPLDLETGVQPEVGDEESPLVEVVQDEDPVDAPAPDADRPAIVTATHPALEGDRRVDWAAVRQEAETTERAPLAANNPLLAKNPPKRIDPTKGRERSTKRNANQDRPWWMSDTAIGVLLVAFILTMIYVVLVASGVL